MTGKTSPVKARPRLLWVMLDKKPRGIPFRFVRLIPFRIFGVEILAVWRHE